MLDCRPTYDDVFWTVRITYRPIKLIYTASAYCDILQFETVICLVIDRHQPMPAADAKIGYVTKQSNNVMH